MEYAIQRRGNATIRSYYLYALDVYKCIIAGIKPDYQAIRKEHGVSASAKIGMENSGMIGIKKGKLAWIGRKGGPVLNSGGVIKQHCQDYEKSKKKIREAKKPKEKPMMDNLFDKKEKRAVTHAEMRELLDNQKRDLTLSFKAELDKVIDPTRANMEIVKSKTK